MRHVSRGSPAPPCCRAQAAQAGGVEHPSALPSLEMSQQITTEVKPPSLTLGNKGNKRQRVCIGELAKKSSSCAPKLSVARSLLPPPGAKGEPARLTQGEPGLAVEGSALLDNATNWRKSSRSQTTGLQTGLERSVGPLLWLGSSFSLGAAH